MRKKKSSTVAAVAEGSGSSAQTEATALINTETLPKPSLSARFWSKFKAFEVRELDNSKGSVARDHLANERTFLAWLRTSLSFSSAGVAVTQLLRLNTSSPDRDSDVERRLRPLGRPAGVLLIGIALFTVSAGCYRYYSAQQSMMRGKFPASRLFVGALSVLTILVLLAGFGLLLLLNQSR